MVVSFAPEPQERYAALGRRGCFAGRTARAQTDALAPQVHGDVAAAGRAAAAALAFPNAMGLPPE